MKPPGKVPLYSPTMRRRRERVFRRADAARNADVIHRGHVHQEAAGQRDVAGDARALLAQRFLGDLHDDFLARLQHFGNQLRTALRRVPAVAVTLAVALRRTSMTHRAPAALMAAAAHWPLKPRAAPVVHARAAGLAIKLLVVSLRGSFGRLGFS